MRAWIRHLTLAAGLVAAPLATGPTRAAVFSPESFTLDNGLQVVVIPNHLAPVVTHMLWYRVGAADEARGTSGIAHFLEHLMFKPTKTTPSAQFSKTVARNGGVDNAFTAADYTAYFQTIAKDRLELVMGLEADRMTNLVFEEEAVRREREVILEERRQRIENSPGARLREQIMAALFLNSPYQTPIIGWRHEMERLTLADAERWYRTWYAPNNAILVLSGDVTAETVKPLAEKYYGVIPRREVPARDRPTEPPVEAERRVVLRDGQVFQPSLSRSWLAPGYRTGRDGEAYALEVAGEVLDGETGRLYRKLVIESKIATSAGASYNPESWDATSFGAYASPAPEVEIADLDAALTGEIAQVAKAGFTEAEVAAAKERMRRQAILARDSIEAPARVFGAALTTGQTITDVEAWPDRIAAVTAEAATAALRRVVEKPGVTGWLLPKEGTKAPPAGATPPTPTLSLGGGPIR